MMKSNFKFIVNPAAARGKCARVAKDLLAICKKNKIDFDTEFTTKPNHATEIAHKAADDFGCIVAVGGDGTIHEVVNGIMGKKVSFGIIPVGSGNDFVHAMKIPIKLETAFNTLLAMNTRKIDIGQAGDRYFPNGLGVGFDAWVVEESFKIKRLRGKAIYLYAVLKTIYSYASPFMRLSYNGKVREEKIYMLTAGNGVSLGGGFKLTPLAKLDDGLLDLNIIRDLSKIEVYQNLLGVYSGNHIKLPQVTVDRTKQLLIESEEGFAVHIDGELLSLNIKSLEVKIVPKALDVVAPKSESVA